MLEYFDLLDRVARVASISDDGLLGVADIFLLAIDREPTLSLSRLS